MATFLLSVGEAWFRIWSTITFLLSVGASGSGNFILLFFLFALLFSFFLF